MTTATIADAPPAAGTSPQADVARIPVPARALAAAPKPSRRHLWVLLGITILGGVLRFSFPTRPLLWGDDAYTVYRTHADYQSMLDILQNDGFTPLHYELYWLIGRLTGTKDTPMWPGGPKIVHSTGMTPAALRLLPATFGTIMVPAMYLVAVQLVRRRTALAVALVTACSAYLLGYSRDMKMYMMVWCFSALSAGCLLWWFRTGTRLSFLAWVASSLAMASSHMTGMALLPFEAIFFFTRSNVRWQQSLLFLIGLAVAVLPPAGYMTQFNRWVQESVEDFGFEVEGLGWVVEYNTGRDGPDLLRYATSAYLLSWEWPRDLKENRVAPWILTTLKAAVVLILLLVAAGAMPWSRKLRGLPETPLSDETPQPWWRVWLWLGLWIIVPTYFMYCRSVVGFASPGVWWEEARAFIAADAWKTSDGKVREQFWQTLTVVAAVVAVLVAVLPRFRRALVTAIPAAAVTFLAVCLLRAGWPSKPDAGTEARVLTLFNGFWLWAYEIAQPAVITALIVVLPGLIIYYCGATWRQRVTRIVQFAAVLAILLVCCNAVHSWFDAKFQKEVAQFVKRTGKEPTAYDLNRTVWASIFMPRYIGFVWIALCIGGVSLLMRLPTRPLRYAAILLVVGVNLAQFGGRLFAGTEPPLDRVAADLWRYDSHNPNAEKHDTLIYIDDTPIPGSGHPGYGVLTGQQGKYYLGLAKGEWIHPREWRGTLTRYFDMPTRRGEGGGGGGSGRPPRGSSKTRDPDDAPEMDYDAIAAAARRSSTAKRIILWEKFFDSHPRDKTRDPLEGLTKNGWRRADVADYMVRFHWNWEDLYLYRRSEYVKVDAPVSK